MGLGNDEGEVESERRKERRMACFKETYLLFVSTHINSLSSLDKKTISQIIKSLWKYFYSIL